MRIGIDAFVLRAPRTGIGQVTRNLLKCLAEMARARSHSFVLYTSEASFTSFGQNFSERVLPLPRQSRLQKKWWEMRTLVKAARADRCDAFLSLYQSGAVFPRSMNHVMVVHDVIHLIFPEFTNTLAKRLEVALLARGIRHASTCIAVSEHTRRDVIARLKVSRERTLRAYNSVDPLLAQMASTTQMDAVLRKYTLERGYIYHGGGLAERKNSIGVLEAYAFLARRAKGASWRLPKLVISGHLERDAAGKTAIEQAVARLGIGQDVALLGEVPQEDLPGLYRAASVFVFPSRYEGFGLPVLEAMHQGVPVVTSAVSSLPEVAGNAAFYCDPGKVESIAGAIELVLADKEAASRAVALGLHRAAGFQWNDFAETLLNSLRA